jgi:hypothetical protein
MKLEDFRLSEISQGQKDNSACFLSYVEYRSNTNTSNIVYTEHKSTNVTGKEDQGRKKGR